MQSGASFRLIVRRGPQPNQQYELIRDTVTLGRDITNDIVINDPEVSRHHARIVRTPSGYTIEDLRSTNGTFVNRQRLTTPYQLTDGDLVGLGETVTLAYEAVGVDEAVATVARGVEPPRAASAPPPPATYPAPPPAPDDDEEEFLPDRNRWIVIGCGVLTLLFCCTLVAAVIFIDSYQGGVLWCQIPILNQILASP